MERTSPAPAGRTPLALLAATEQGATAAVPSTKKGDTQAQGASSKAVAKYDSMNAKMLAIYINEYLIPSQDSRAQSFWKTVYEDIVIGDYAKAKVIMETQPLGMMRSATGEYRIALQALDDKMTPGRIDESKLAADYGSMSARELAVYISVELVPNQSSAVQELWKGVLNDVYDGNYSSARSRANLCLTIKGYSPGVVPKRGEVTPSGPINGPATGECAKAIQAFMQKLGSK